MPHLFFASSEQDHRASSQPPEYSLGEKGNMWGKTWNKVGHWLKKEDENEPPPHAEVPVLMDEKEREKEVDQSTTPTRPQRRVVPSLPRPTTFARQNSERRDKLCPVEPGLDERRAISVDRRGQTTHLRCASPPPAPIPSSNSPKTHAPDSVGPENNPSSYPLNQCTSQAQFEAHTDEHRDEDTDLHPQPGLSHNDLLRDPEHLSDALDNLQIQAELEAKWILNLSMHFRDNSDREKFFITYAEEPSKWRRVTVSCDYRAMPADSLEADIKSLHYQRDKSARIYESIRDSLLDIQFYPTVTNLKLQTSDGRLHVHVTEDVNEIIQYPSVSLLGHIECKHFKESAIEFDSHLSGFVYKVRSGGRVYIKKEIPGPEAVEEFLYEANALSSLRDSQNVVQFEGIVVDDKKQVVKGLLLSYAEQGALVDLIYDYKHTEWFPWARRERWAKQIVAGLADIHESGFVQGDFTLSNIVVDEADSARIIDINRRGCPVGWEPPELARLIQSGQRISSYIGVKSDLYQLGMVLWALAEQQDEPERQEQPLQFTNPHEIPDYYHAIVQSCLSEKLRDRSAAKDLLKQFPILEISEAKQDRVSSAQLSPNRSEKKYIDPATAVGLEDLDYLKSLDQIRQHSQFSASEATFADAAPSTEYLFVSSGSEMANTRGRSSARTSLDESVPNRSRSNYRDFADKPLQQAVVEANLTIFPLDTRSPVVEEDLTSHSFATISPPTTASRQDSETTIIDVKDHTIPDQFLHDSHSEYVNKESIVEQPVEHIVDSDITIGSRFGPPTHQDSGFDELTIVDIVCSPDDLTSLYEAGLDAIPTSIEPGQSRPSLDQLRDLPVAPAPEAREPHSSEPDKQSKQNECILLATVNGLSVDSIGNGQLGEQTSHSAMLKSHPPFSDIGTSSTESLWQPNPLVGATLMDHPSPPVGLDEYPSLDEPGQPNAESEKRIPSLRNLDVPMSS